MNVSLTPELEQFIAQKVASGRYISASEVARDGLRLLAEREELHARRLAQLDAEIAAGIEQADRGELIDGEASRQRLAAKYAAHRQQ